VRFSKFLGFFWPVFGGFSPETDPKTLEIGLSAKNGAECTQNQPRRPIPRPLRGVFRRGLGGGVCFRTQPYGPVLKREAKKRVEIKIFGPVFLGFSPEIDPGIPLDRPGAPRTSICTKKQPRRPILRPFRCGLGGGVCFRTHPYHSHSQCLGPGTTSVFILNVHLGFLICDFLTDRRSSILGI